MRIADSLSSPLLFARPNFSTRPSASEVSTGGFRSESRNTIRQDNAIEALRLTHDNRISDATRGVGASNAVHEGSPEVSGQVRTILHLIGEVRDAVPAHFHLRCADRDQGWRFKSELGRFGRDEGLPSGPSGMAKR